MTDEKIKANSTKNNNQKKSKSQKKNNQSAQKNKQSQQKNQSLQQKNINDKNQNNKKQQQSNNVKAKHNNHQSQVDLPAGKTIDLHQEKRRRMQTDTVDFEQKKATAKRSPKRVSRKTLRKRRFIRNVISLILVALVVTAAIVASLKMLFIVRDVTVQGSENFTQEEIVAFCNILPESPIFSVDTKGIEEKILQQYTYIETAKISRKLPDKLLITLTDSVETYCVQSPENVKVYSQNFKFLRTTDAVPDAVIALEVDFSNEKLLEIAKEVLALFEKHGLNDVKALSVTSENDIKAWYQNRFEISLGSMLDIDYKIKMCKNVISQKISTEEKGTLDATISGEVVYKRQ